MVQNIYCKTYRYRNQASYRCSIVHIVLWMNKKSWETIYGKNKGQYEKDIKNLASMLKQFIKKIPRKSLANYCGGFISTHEEAATLARGGYSPFPIGVACVGRLKCPGITGR